MVTLKSGTDQLPVLLEQGRIGLALALEQPRRALDVGKEERDAAARGSAMLGPNYGGKERSEEIHRLSPVTLPTTHGR